MSEFDPARGPERAHSLIVSIGADTVDDLCYALNSLSQDARRGALTRGCSGGPSCGWTYSYRHKPEQTHDNYFREIDEWLARDSGSDRNGEDSRSEAECEASQSGPKGIAQTTANNPTDSLS
jgi:hypothetical protein